MSVLLGIMLPLTLLPHPATFSLATFPLAIPPQEPADATDGPSLARHYFSDLSELCEAEQVHVEDVEQRGKHQQACSHDTMIVVCGLHGVHRCCIRTVMLPCFTSFRSTATLTYA